MRRKTCLLSVSLGLLLIPVFTASPREYTLARLLNSLEINSCRISRLRAEGEKSRINLRAAKARRLPDVDFSASFSYLANPMDPITVTAGEFGTAEVPGQGEVLLPPEDMTVFPGMESTYYSFDLTVSQPVFTWGKIPNSIELYRQAGEASELQVRNALIELSGELSGYLYTLYFMNKLEKILDSQNEIGSRMVRIARESFKNGFIVKADLLDAEIKAKEVEIEQRRLETEKGQIITRIRSLTGIADLTFRDLSFSFVDESLPDKELPAPESLIGKAQSGNPGLKLLEKLKQIDLLKLEIAKGTGYLKPDLGLQLDLGYTGPRMPLVETDWFRKNDYGLTVSLGVTTKVYDGGKLASEIALSRQDTEITEIRYREAVAEISRNIRTLLLTMDMSRTNMEYQLLKKEAVDAQAELEKKRFQAGAGSETDFLSLQLEGLGHQAAYYTEKISFYKNYVTLGVLTGENFPFSL
ncbi:MAG: TolC family protein [Spirochaetia bacterium]